MSQKNKNILNHLISGIVIMIFIMPFLVRAEDAGGTGNPADAGGLGQPPPVKIDIEIKNPFKQDTIKGLIETIVNDILIPIGAVIAVMMIMYAGFLYVTAGGNEAKITKAHQALLWAVIGAAILLGAWVIEKAISATIDQLKA